MQRFSTHLSLCSLAAVLVFLASGVAQGGIVPGDLWLAPGESYLDLTDTNATNAASNWGWPDGSDDAVTVYGNVADDKNHSPIEMDMTVSGLVAEVEYNVDVVFVGKRDELDEFGLAAGLVSGSLTNYLASDGSEAYYDDVEGAGLYRIPLGISLSDAGGAVHVYLDDEGEGSSIRSEIDGVIYSTYVEPPPRLIGAVDRSNGQSDDRAPIGVFDGETDPLPSPDFGMLLGRTAYSDRDYPFDLVDDPLLGADWVRTFNTDKNTGEDDVNYAVNFLDEVFALVLMDDRYGEDQQAMVDLAVEDFAGPGTFVDTGWDVSLDESNEYNFSAFQARLAAGTYNFGENQGNSFYMVGAIPIPEPSTLALLGMAGLALLFWRRRRA